MQNVFVCKQDDIVYIIQDCNFKAFVFKISKVIFSAHCGFVAFSCLMEFPNPTSNVIVFMLAIHFNAIVPLLIEISYLTQTTTLKLIIIIIYLKRKEHILPQSNLLTLYKSLIRITYFLLKVLKQ